jgi:hypothetical protein
MSYTISSQQDVYEYQETTTRPSALVRFFKWAENEDKINHVSWVGISVTAMAAVIFPLTMAVVLLNGASFGCIIAAMVSLVLVVVTNLAALPTKYTIPFLFLGGLIDVVAIISSFFIS